MMNFNVNESLLRYMNKKHRFCFLQSVVLYKGDKEESDLFANEIDYLIHCEIDGNDTLVIVEVKNQVLKVTKDKKWLAYYTNKEKEVKKQVLNQMHALRQFCSIISNEIPSIEAWIVDKGKRDNGFFGLSDSQCPGIYLFTFEEFMKKISIVGQ